MTLGVEHYLQNIRENSHVRFYVATNWAMLGEWYPYILGRPNSRSSTLSGCAESYILDSDIGDAETTNGDVLRGARDLEADIVLPADVIDDPSTTTERTVEMACEIDENDDEFQMWLPLQSTEDRSHVDHYHQMADALRDRGFDPEGYPLSIGGIMGTGIVDQLEAIVDVRTAVGPDRHIHGLGMGVQWAWAVIIQRYPELLDSFDNSTIFKNVINNKILDHHLQVIEYPRLRGANSTCLSVLMSVVLVHQVCYLLGSDIRESDQPSEFHLPEETVDEIERILQRYEDRASVVV